MYCLNSASIKSIKEEKKAIEHQDTIKSLEKQVSEFDPVHDIGRLIEEAAPISMINKEFTKFEGSMEKMVNYQSKLV